MTNKPGRPALPDNERRRTVSIRLSPWVLVQVDLMGQRSATIEKALIRAYKLKKPKGLGKP